MDGGTGWRQGAATVVLEELNQAQSPANKPPSKVRREGPLGFIVVCSRGLKCWLSAEVIVNDYLV